MMLITQKLFTIFVRGGYFSSFGSVRYQQLISPLSRKKAPLRLPFFSPFFPSLRQD